MQEKCVSVLNDLHASHQIQIPQSKIVPKKLTFYLKRPQNQVKNQPQLSLHLLWDECKHDKIDSKQRNQKQCWFRQPPETTEREREKREISPSGETSFESVSICANNEMQLKSTFHFTFQLWGPEMGGKTPLKRISGKIAHALWPAYETPSITGENTISSTISLCKAAVRERLLWWVSHKAGIEFLFWCWKRIGHPCIALSIGS